ncbi:MAG: DUF1244 domain-containing protein [Sedimenticolaceae bacterium]|jgi:hypothetical protein
MTPEQQMQMEALAWRKLVSHFQKRKDVQNIDLMNMAGFCRNCMSKWLMGGAKDVGIEMDYDQARELVYGMTYDEWKNNHQEKATQEQLDKYNALKPDQITE